MTAPAAPPPAVRLAKDIDAWATVVEGRITCVWPEWAHETHSMMKSWEGGEVRIARVRITEIPGADDGR